MIGGPKVGYTLLRCVVAGIVAGIASAIVIFFLFGFIGLAGGSLLRRMANGWDAGTELGIDRGVGPGIGIAVLLSAATLDAWATETNRLASRRARTWMAAVVGAIVIVGNLTRERDISDLEVVATIGLMGGVTAAAVWFVTPWALRPLNRS